MQSLPELFVVVSPLRGSSSYPHSTPACLHPSPPAHPCRKERGTDGGPQKRRGPGAPVPAGANFISRLRR